jgi:hypothetical protein
MERMKEEHASEEGALGRTPVAIWTTNALVVLVVAGLGIVD